VIALGDVDPDEELVEVEVEVVPSEVAEEVGEDVANNTDEELLEIADRAQMVGISAA